MGFIRWSWKSFLIKTNYYLFLFVFFAMFLTACHSSEKKSQKTNLVSIAESPLDSDYAKQVNDVLLGELYNQLGDAKSSAKHYQNLLEKTQDPAIAKRATALAATSGLNQDALKAARTWLALVPNSLEARQYFSLLLLRNNDFDQSVEQIHQIRQLVEKKAGEDNNKKIYSKGLKFIGSMLNIESHHKKSLNVFHRYIEKYGHEEEKTQQYLILSSLAMNAEQYDIVLTALSAIDDEDLKQTSKITLMKVKALQSLDKIDDAVVVLQGFVDNQQPDDSTILQLVRLLILNDQKKTASPYLKDLVDKYPDNNDLLKSLIALEIDQSQLQSAKNNVKKLSKSKDYHSDAAYFMGEISEAEGDVQSALKSYQKVVNGSLQKRAQKKIIKLKILN